jgi:hypothetical protein
MAVAEVVGNFDVTFDVWPALELATPRIFSLNVIPPSFWQVPYPPFCTMTADRTLDLHQPPPCPRLP